ncbi:MAG: SUF system Fe-S cluster assembly protein [Bacteroidetes bacterium]|nr:SUF system Fe-S cluster assembly protein [Bacteroidota bacterium]
MTDGRMLTNEQLQEIDDNVVHAIKTCYDPEIPINIFELGLIYQIRVKSNGGVSIRMTLTSPNCPAAQSLPAEVKEKVGQINGVTGVDIDIVWDPPWNPSMMSEAARLELGFF